MRTRSQPLSPASQVSLDAPRQTRSMRARSASRTSPQEETVITTTEETTVQPATTKKTTGAKKSATTKKTATTKRSAATRRAATARKTDTTTTKTSSQSTKAPASSALKAMEKRKSTKKTTRKSSEEASQEATDDALETVEAEAMPTKSSDSPNGTQEEGDKTTEAASSAEDALSEPKGSDLNRKRGRVDSSPEAQDTPTVKRRALRPPGTTSLSRRLFPLSRRLSTTNVSYTERLRRRAAERKGRIHTTVFRLPELVAQTEADRQAEEAEPSSPCPPAPESAMDFSGSPDSRNIDQPSTSQEPQTPVATRGWNIRGLINSVPRTFSRFLPGLGRSPDRTQESASQVDSSPTSRPSSETPSVSPATTPRSSGEGTNDKLNPVVGNTQNSAKKLDLSYSLFPRPIDRSLYLPPASETKDNQEQQPQLQQEQEPQIQEQVTSENATVPVEERASREAVSTQEKKKRKRSPSPDVIPNPPGCSYGLDLDYFCYSSESDEDEPGNETPRAGSVSKPTPLDKSAAYSSQHPSKKVRFDSSPEATPSKLRGRATDPYQGRNFLGLGDSPPASEKAAPEPTMPVPHVASPVQRPPGFIPNTQGTFGFDYDDFSDDSSSSGPSTPGSVAPSETSTPAQAPRPTPPKAVQASPNTPATKIDSEALAKVRSQAEKYKPKTPSGLRTASRYSSSPMVLSPDVSPTKPESHKISKQPSHAIEENVPEKPAAPEKQEPEKFGDDKFARDAEWLYEKCPSGDLSKFAWPAKRSLVDRLGIDPAAEELVNAARDDMDLDTGHRAFQHGMEEFALTLV